MSWDGKMTGSYADRASKPNHRNVARSEYYSQFLGTSLLVGPEGKKTSMPMAYHHITDWAMLRLVWNKLVDDKQFAPICAWLYAVGFDVNYRFYRGRDENIVYDTDRAPQTPAGITMAIRDGRDVEDVAEASEVHERITWSTWNLVEGPKENTRSDDLGNFHDKFSDVRTGLDDLERADLRAADRVYTAMANVSTAKTVTDEKARELCAALLGVNRRAQVIKYRPEMWVQDTGTKKWRKDR